MSCLSSRWTRGICQVCHRGKSVWVIVARLGWKKRGRRFGCQSRKCNYLHGMHAVLLLTERILDQARGASVPLHLLAWARGALSRHRTAGLYTESESLDASRRRSCGGSLQVKWQPNQNIARFKCQNMPVNNSPRCLSSSNGAFREVFVKPPRTQLCRA